MNEREAMFWRAGEGGAAVCELCPHGCVIQSGGTGFCGVRENRGGTLYAANYGHVTALALDPIEKKPLYRFNPGTSILSVGSYGCNMRCGFCQNAQAIFAEDAKIVLVNHDISQSRAESERLSPERLVETAAGVAAERRNIGVAFTYNEPTIGIEYILDAAPLLREKGQKVVLVSNGQINEGPLAALAPLVDAWNIDVKAFRGDFYEQHGGDLETTKRAVETAARFAHVEVTTLIVPGENDDEAEIAELAKWLASVDKMIPLHLTGFFPRHKYAEKTATPRKTIRHLTEVAQKRLEHVFMGNMG